MSRTQRVALVVAAGAAVAAAFVIAQPDDDDDGGQPTAPRRPAATRTAPAAPQKPRVTRIVVRGGEAVGGVRSIRAKKGDTVRLAVRSADTRDHVHVHGYDLMRDLAPGKPASLRFRASIEGVFEIELEDRGEQIANLVVEPS